MKLTNHYKISCLSALLGLSFTLPATFTFAESPQAEESPSSAKQGHARPQIIYHLANGSRETAEALHAQSKAVDNLLDVSPNMPISLQLARTNANTAAQVAAATPTPADREVSPKVNGKPKAERRSSRRSRGAISDHGRGNEKHGRSRANGHRSEHGGGNGH